MRTFPGHNGFVEAVTFSPDGRTFATASADGTARLWDVLAPTPGDAIVSTPRRSSAMG